MFNFLKTKEECMICLENISLLNIATTFCKHKFHKRCIIKWTDENDTCPLCRTKEPMDIRKHQRRIRFEKITKKNEANELSYNYQFLPERLACIVDNYFEVVNQIDTIDIREEEKFVNKTICHYLEIFKHRKKHTISIISINKAINKIAYKLFYRLTELNN